jgi:hypothetical protein
VEHLRNSGLWKQLSWLCVVFLLLMSSAQAAHICPLTDDYQPQHGSAAQWSAAPSTHAFCAICASSHSPSLAAPFASLVSFKSPSGQFLAGNVVERSASPRFALYIRPPPAR